MWQFCNIRSFFISEMVKLDMYMWQKRPYGRFRYNFEMGV